MRDFPQFLKVEVMKMTPEQSVPLRSQSDHDPTLTEHVPRPSAGQASPSIFQDTFCPAKHSVSCIRYLSKTHFVQESPQNLKVEDVETKLSCETFFKSESGRCGNEGFVRDFPQNLKAEDMETKLWCETSLKI